MFRSSDLWHDVIMLMLMSDKFSFNQKDYAKQCLYDQIAF